GGGFIFMGFVAASMTAITTYGGNDVRGRPADEGVAVAVAVSAATALPIGRVVGRAFRRGSTRPPTAGSPTTGSPTTGGGGAPGAPAAPRPEPPPPGGGRAGPDYYEVTTLPNTLRPGPYAGGSIPARGPGRN